MSFREKSAWISLGCLLIFTCIWLAHFVRINLFRALARNDAKWFFGTMAALIALEIGLHLAIAVQSPKDARTPKDEREQLIDVKASRVAFYVLLTGALVSLALGLHMPGATRFTMGQLLMGSILSALLARFGLQIAMYRRDA